MLSHQIVNGSQGINKNGNPLAGAHTFQSIHPFITANFSLSIISNFRLNVFDFNVLKINKMETLPGKGDGDPAGVEGFDGKLLLVWSGE